MKRKRCRTTIIIIPLLAICIGLGLVNSSLGDSPDVLISVVKNDVTVKTVSYTHLRAHET